MADAGLYHCEANNGVGKSKSCVGNHMTIGERMLLCVEDQKTYPNTYRLHVSLVFTFHKDFILLFHELVGNALFSHLSASDDLNVPGIVAGIVILCLVIFLCILGVCYAYRQGYFNRKFTKNDFYMLRILCRSKGSKIN